MGLRQLAQCTKGSLSMLKLHCLNRMVHSSALSPQPGVTWKFGMFRTFQMTSGLALELGRFVLWTEKRRKFKHPVDKHSGVFFVKPCPQEPSSLPRRLTVFLMFFCTAARKPTTWPRARARPAMVVLSAAIIKKDKTLVASHTWPV